MNSIQFEWLDHSHCDGAAEDLADILHACVSAGASVSFIQPFTLEDSVAFWERKVFPAMASGGVRLLAARIDGRIVGTVQLIVEMPPNQAHRVEVAKLLVHPAFRKKGIATALMERLEELARQLGRSLVTLDTRSGDHAEPLYIMLGYKIAGRIPNFAKAPDCDRLDSTTYMYKILD